MAIYYKLKCQKTNLRWDLHYVIQGNGLSVKYTLLAEEETNETCNKIQNEMKYNKMLPHSIFSSTSSLVFLFQPFIVATRFTNPTIWVLLYSYKSQDIFRLVLPKNSKIRCLPKTYAKHEILQGEHGPNGNILFREDSKPVP